MNALRLSRVNSRFGIGIRSLTQNHRPLLVSSLSKPIKPMQTIRSRLNSPCANLSYKLRCREEPQRQTDYADKITSGMLLAGSGTFCIMMCGGVLILIDVWLDMIATYYDVPILYLRLGVISIPIVLFIVGVLF